MTMSSPLPTPRLPPALTAHPSTDRHRKGLRQLCREPNDSCSTHRQISPLPRQGSASPCIRSGSPRVFRAPELSSLLMLIPTARRRKRIWGTAGTARPWRSQDSKTITLAKSKASPSPINPGFSPYTCWTSHPEPAPLTRQRRSRNQLRVLAAKLCFQLGSKITPSESRTYSHPQKRFHTSA